MSEKSEILPARERMDKKYIIPGDSDQQDKFLDVLSLDYLDEQTLTAATNLMTILGALRGQAITSINELISVLKSKGLLEKIKNDPNVIQAMEQLNNISSESEFVPEMMAECYRHATIDVFNRTIKEQKKSSRAVILAFVIAAIPLILGIVSILNGKSKLHSMEDKIHRKSNDLEKKHRKILQENETVRQERDFYKREINRCYNSGDNLKECISRIVRTIQATE